MIKAILLDCGGVLVAPATGDWLVPPGYGALLGEDFLTADEGLPAFRKERGKHFHLLPDLNRMDTDEEECSMFVRFYGEVFAAMGRPLSEDAAARLAHMQTYADERYVFFDDVLPTLAAWRGQYELGIVSDAPPSTRRILRNAGVMAMMDGATFSSDLGVLKPDPAIYQSTLRQIGVEPEEAVFVDDFPSKLAGAVALGILGIQMRRPMPALFGMPQAWDGPVAQDLAGVEAIVRGMNGG